MWIERTFSEKLIKSALSRPAILLTGVRQSGKSSLLKHIFPKAKYVTLDNLLQAESSEKSPKSFIQSFKDEENVIIDEIQYAPSLFRELKIAIDQNRKQYGKWILTGSQKFSLMKEVRESLAGRIEIHHLETLSTKEIRNYNTRYEEKLTVNDYITKGGYPELWSNPALENESFFESYIQSYIEKDLREIINVSELRDFRRFFSACAHRSGKLVNYTELGKDVGVSGQTAKTWLSALETSGIIYLLSPYFKNLGKRLVKAPKLYFADNGLLAYLLGINTLSNNVSSEYGHLWETLVFNELIKTRDLIPNRNIFFYRDQNAVEIDFLIEKNDKVELIEAKAGEKINEKKLNFRKVAKLFTKEITSTVACRTMEEGLIDLGEYQVYNPIKYSLK